MEKEKSIVNYMTNEVVKKNIAETLGQKAPQFIASVASLVNSSNSLAECDRQSILSACLVAASLDLPINQNLGFAYIIAYNTKFKSCDQEGKEITTWVKKAQFQMGYKGFIQLAQRSGQFKTINVTDVKESELGNIDKLTGELTFNWVTDEKERDKLTTVGYVGYFKLINGFEKALYMTVEDLRKHGVRYSKSYKDGLWQTDFDAMASKTVIKLLLSKYAPMTTEMQKAQLADQAVIDNDNYEYIDNKRVTPEEYAQDKERNRIINHIDNAKNIEELKMCEGYIDEEELQEKYKVKEKELLTPDVKSGKI